MGSPTVRKRKRRRSHRQVSAKLLAAMLHVCDLRRFLFRTVGEPIFCGLIRHWNVEDFAEGHESVFGKLLLLMGGVERPGGAESITFYGLDQNHGWPTLMVGR